MSAMEPQVECVHDFTARQADPLGFTCQWCGHMRECMEGPLGCVCETAAHEAASATSLDGKRMQELLFTERSWQAEYSRRHMAFAQASDKVEEAEAALVEVRKALAVTLNVWREVNMGATAKRFSLK